MMLDIIFEDSEILVVRKPAGIESQSGKSLAMDMVSLIKNELVFRQRKFGKQGMREPYIGVIHRLDRPVSGVMVYAKTPAAAAELSRQVQQHKMQKRYYALLCDKPKECRGTLTDYLVHDKKNNRSYIVKKDKVDDAKAKKAILQYEMAEEDFFHGFDFIQQKELKHATYLVDIRLITGRHHQIRVQFANIGCPLWGDTKYNPEWIGKKGMTGIGLCAYELTFLHPKTKKEMTFHY